MKLIQLVNSAAAKGSPISGTFVTSVPLLTILGQHPLREDSIANAFILRLRYECHEIVFDIQSSRYHRRLASLAEGTFPRKVLRATRSHFNTTTKKYEIFLEWTAAGEQDYDSFTVKIAFNDPTMRSGTFELGLRVYHRFPYWKKQLDQSLGIIQRVTKKAP